jgi:hypothetical protein
MLRDEFGELCLHLGWAFLGQECDCGHNPFNWLARLIGPGKFDDDKPHGFTRITYPIGSFFYRLGCRFAL